LTAAAPLPSFPRARAVITGGRRAEHALSQHVSAAAFGAAAETNTAAPKRFLRFSAIITGG